MEGFHDASKSSEVSIFFGHRSSLKSTIILLPLLGITWIIGVLAINENTTVFAWLFTVLNSLQVSHSLM